MPIFKCFWIDYFTLWLHNFVVVYPDKLRISFFDYFCNSIITYVYCRKSRVAYFSHLTYRKWVHNNFAGVFNSWLCFNKLKQHCRCHTRQNVCFYSTSKPIRQNSNEPAGVAITLWDKIVSVGILIIFFFLCTININKHYFSEASLFCGSVLTS